jgi:hypothetical protein
VKITWKKSEGFLNEVLLQKFPNGFDLHEGEKSPDL